MGKQRARCGAGKCRGHVLRNTVISLSVLGLLLIAMASSLTTSPLSTAPGFTKTFNNGNWDMNTRLGGGEVTGNAYFHFFIPPSVDTAALPSQVTEITGTTLGIDPDLATKTWSLGPAKYYSQAQWDQNVPSTNGGDPTVYFSISNLWAAVDANGADAPGGTPVIAKQFSGITPDGKPCTWYNYYWKVSVGMRTFAKYCSVPQVGAGMWVANYEHNQVTATLYLDVSFQSKVTNASFWWSFMDASVYSGEVGVYPTAIGPPDEAQNGGANGNWPWAASLAPNSAVHTALSTVAGVTSGQSSGFFRLQVSAILRPGEIFTKDSWGNIDGVVRDVDMQAKVTVLYGISVTEPLTVPPNPPQGLEWILDWIANAMQDPTSWHFWVLVGAAVLVVYMLVPKRRRNGVHIHLDGGNRRKSRGA